MRWRSRILRWKNGERVTVRRFLWFPKRLGPHWRWLEWATWERKRHVFENQEAWWEDLQWSD